MSHEECREWIEIELFDAIVDDEAGQINLHLAFCPACDRHRVERREMKALAEDAPVGETKDERLQRVLAGFGRVLDAQLAECDEWELRGDFCVNPITIRQLTGGESNEDRFFARLIHR